MFDWSTMRKVNNFVEDATDHGAGNLKWDSTTVCTLTVPDGKRWYLIGGTTYRDQAATVSVIVYDNDDKPILPLMYDSAGTGRRGFPHSDAYSASEAFKAIPCILDQGEYIKFEFGAAQDAVAYVTALVMEGDV